MEASELNASPDNQPGILTEDTTNKHWTPETVLSELPIRPQVGTTSPVPFFHLLERLKTTKREGWRRFQINHGESIADHMYRMSILTMLAPPSLASRLNIPHCTKMALIHDMAESLVGDITPVDNVLKQEKARREEETMDYIASHLLGNVNGGIPGQDIRKIWQEYEDNETDEAKFVHDIDKVELVLQMIEYEQAHQGSVDLGEFSWVARKIILPECKDWCARILQERAQFWKDIGKVPTGTAVTQEHEAQLQDYYGAKS